MTINSNNFIFLFELFSQIPQIFLDFIRQKNSFHKKKVFSKHRFL